MNSECSITRDKQFASCLFSKIRAGPWRLKSTERDNELARFPSSFLTRSAVRAQITGMERDGVVQRAGQRPGFLTSCANSRTASRARPDDHGPPESWILRTDNNLCASASASGRGITRDHQLLSHPISSHNVRSSRTCRSLRCRARRSCSGNARTLVRVDGSRIQNCRRCVTCRLASPGTTCRSCCRKPHIGPSLLRSQSG